MDAEKKSGLIYFILGVGLALLIWGVQLIGVVVNIFLGGIVLAIAFGLVVYAFWIWERPSTWHVLLRIGTIAIAAVIYFLLVGKQMVAEWHKEHLVVATKSQEPIPPTSPVSSPQKAPAKKLPTKRAPKDQQQSGKDSIQTGPITQGPGSIAQIGGTGNQASVNNYGSMDRHITQVQESGLTELARLIPKDAPILFFIPISDDEADTVAEELALRFVTEGRAFHPARGRSWTPTNPKGVVLTVKSQNDPAFPLAKQIETTMTNLGIPGVELMIRPDLKENYISVTIGGKVKDKPVGAIPISIELGP